MTEDLKEKDETKAEAGSTETKEKTTKRSNTVLIALIAVVIVLLIVIIIVLLNRKTPEVPQQPAAAEDRPSVITRDNVRDFLENVPVDEGNDSSSVDASTYTVTMNTNWKFENGDSYCDNAYVANSEEDNTTPVYFDVVMADNEEDVLFASPVLPLGAVMTGNQIKLSRHLDAGDYNAVCVYHLIDEQQNTLSTVRVKLTIQVLN